MIQIRTNNSRSIEGSLTISQGIDKIERNLRDHRLFPHIDKISESSDFGIDYIIVVYF